MKTIFLNSIFRPKTGINNKDKKSFNEEFCHLHVYIFLYFFVGLFNNPLSSLESLTSSSQLVGGSRDFFGSYRRNHVP